MSTFAVKGGIGDFLQCLPFMLKHPKNWYLVASHYERAPEFFAAVGLTIEEMPFSRLGGTSLCPRQLFLNKNPFLEQKLTFNNDRPVLGIHLGGSNYSLSVEKRFGFPPKALPVTVLKAIVSANKQYNILVFGLASEFDDLVPTWRQARSDYLKFIADDDITVSLSRVSECSILIGSDSAFKTMSAMLSIPTIVWVGNYRDDFRDSTFITPYVEAGIMSVIPYWDLNSNDSVYANVKQCQEFVSKYAYSKSA